MGLWKNSWVLWTFLFFSKFVSISILQVWQVCEAKGVKAKCEAKGVELDTGKNVRLQCWILYDTAHIPMLDCNVDVFVFV